MATSEINQLHIISELIAQTNPQRTLDLGVGFGKYGVIVREYTEVFGMRETKKATNYNWKKCLDGIEGFEGYISPMHNFIYNKIYIGNIEDVIPTLKERYDLILFIGTLEHLSFEDGQKVLDECERLGKNIIISTPKDVGPCEEYIPNSLQTHRFQWEKKHFDRFKNKFFVPHQGLYIVYIGEQAERIGKKMEGLDRGELRWRIGQRFPLLKKIYSLLK